MWWKNKTQKPPTYNKSPIIRPTQYPRQFDTNPAHRTQYVIGIQRDNLIDINNLKINIVNIQFNFKRAKNGGIIDLKTDQDNVNEGIIPRGTTSHLQNFYK